MKRITFVLACVLSLPHLILSQKPSVRCEDSGSSSDSVSVCLNNCWRRRTI